MLTEEQRDALKKVGDATGVDLVGLVEKQGVDATKLLESRGVRYKNHQPQQPQSFGGQFKDFVRAHRPRQRMKLALVPADPPERNTKLERKLTGALQAAGAGGPDLRPMAQAVKGSRKDAQGALSPENEALARRVYNLPELVALRAMIAKIGEFAGEQEAIEQRLDTLDGGGRSTKLFDGTGRYIGGKVAFGDPAILRGGNGKEKRPGLPWDALYDSMGVTK